MQRHRNVDNHSPAPPLRHGGINSTAHVERALGVNVHHRLESFRTQTLRLGQEVSGGTIHKYIHAAELVRGVFRRSFARGGIPDVAHLVQAQLAREGGEVGRRFSQKALAAAADDGSATAVQ